RPKTSHQLAKNTTPSSCSGLTSGCCRFPVFNPHASPDQRDRAGGAYANAVNCQGSLRHRHQRYQHIVRRSAVFGGGSERIYVGKLSIWTEMAYSSTGILQWFLDRMTQGVITRVQMLKFECSIERPSHHFNTLRHLGGARH
ncbi:hypothetical protein ANANG_G00013220, partial [Anguilla anguilla]